MRKVTKRYISYGPLCTRKYELGQARPGQSSPVFVSTARYRTCISTCRYRSRAAEPQSNNQRSQIFGKDVTWGYGERVQEWVVGPSAAREEEREETADRPGSFALCGVACVNGVMWLWGWMTSHPCR